MYQVLYIGGYSRSGSTVLEMALASDPRIVSTGELTFLIDDADAAHRLCTCGKQYRACERYGSILANLGQRDAKTVRQVEARANLSALRAGSVPEGTSAAYRDIVRTMFDKIHIQTGAKVIVDGSKSAKDAAGRALALSRLAGLDVRFLHLTRSPDAVLDSYRRNGSNWVAEGHRKPRPLENLRPVFGWTLANKIAKSMESDLGAERYIRLKYEDFVGQPEASLERVGAFVDIDLSETAKLIAEGKPLIAEHAVGGNRARHEGARLTQSKVSKPQKTLASLLINRIGQGLISELGYQS